jgi:hypothetical protein
MSRGDKLAFDKVVDEISFAYLALRPNCFCATPPSCKISLGLRSQPIRQRTSEIPPTHTQRQHPRFKTKEKKRLYTSATEPVRQEDNATKKNVSVQGIGKYIQKKHRLRKGNATCDTLARSQTLFRCFSAALSA